MHIQQSWISVFCGHLLCSFLRNDGFEIVQSLRLQHDREQMKLETCIEMQIEILAGGEIRVKCKFKWSQILVRICTARYRSIQTKPWSPVELAPRDTQQFESLDLDLMTNIPHLSSSFICISMTIASLIFSGTGCINPPRLNIFCCWIDPIIKFRYFLLLICWYHPI